MPAIRSEEEERRRILVEDYVRNMNPHDFNMLIAKSRCTYDNTGIGSQNALIRHDEMYASTTQAEEHLHAKICRL